MTEKSKQMEQTGVETPKQGGATESKPAAFEESESNQRSGEIF